MSVYVPESYTNILYNIENTQKGIKLVKDMFQTNLSAQLVLLRVTAPMIVMKGTGLNDDLNGIERPVTFPVKDMNENPAEVVHSLAKWKRLKLWEMGTEPGRGIYTDMNAIRPDEVMDNIHSIYVDQWDWEKIIKKEDRNKETLKYIVEQIYSAFKATELHLRSLYPFLRNDLPKDIYFLTTEELLQLYPDKTPKERE